MQDMLKSRCKFVTLLGKYTYAQQKQVGWEVISSELGFAGSREGKPRRDTFWQGVHFFTNTDITKIIETQCCDESSDKQHW